MLERFTKAARGAVVDAQEQARTFGHREIVPEHVLLGVLADVDGVAAKVLRGLGVEREALVAQTRALEVSDAEALRSIGVDLEAVRRQAEATFGPGALDRPRRQRRGLFRLRTVGGHLPFSKAAKRALERSLREALDLKHNYIGTEHILLGLLADDQGSLPHTVRRLGLDPALVRAQVLEELRRAA